MVSISSIIFVESLEKGIHEPELCHGRSHKEIFEDNPDAQAIWVLLPSAREPYRINWVYGMYGAGKDRRPDDPAPAKKPRKKVSA